MYSCVRFWFIFFCPYWFISTLWCPWDKWKHEVFILEVCVQSLKCLEKLPEESEVTYSFWPYCFTIMELQAMVEVTAKWYLFLQRFVSLRTSPLGLPHFESSLIYRWRSGLKISLEALKKDIQSLVNYGLDSFIACSNPYKLPMFRHFLEARDSLIKDFLKIQKVYILFSLFPLKSLNDLLPRGYLSRIFQTLY